MSTFAILPMKTFDVAKSRLAPEITAGTRKALAEVMFSDVLTALRRTPAIDRIIVITNDNQAERIAGGHGASVLADTGESHNDAAMLGINQALRLGAKRALLVPGDCPLLDPEELGELLAYGVPTPSALIIPDRHGAGTNALLLTPPAALTPAFGEGSCERHFQLATAQGVTPEVVAVRSLALDIDTPEDLVELREAFAARRGGAAHTRGLLNQLVRSEI
jgi:2-phospho-L-lactate/phosphoenolpyruvate guanylyltransferase